MEWYPVPSLQFQSAMAIIKHLYSKPSVVDRTSFQSLDIGKRVKFRYDYNNCRNQIKCTEQCLLATQKNLESDTITNLGLPPLIQKYVLDLVYPVIRQLKEIYVDFVQLCKNNVHRPRYFNNRVCKELLAFVCWTSEGIVDTKKTVRLLLSSLDQSELPHVIDRFEKLKLDCLALLVWDIYNDMWHPFSAWQGLDFQSCLNKIDSFLLTVVPVSRAAIKCIVDGYLNGVKKCWPQMSLNSKLEAIHYVLLHSHCSERLIRYLSQSNNIRYCLAHFDDEQNSIRTSLFKPLFGCQWLELLIKIYLCPEKSFYLRIKELMWQYLSKEQFVALIQCIAVGQVGGIHLGTDIYRQLWKECPLEWKVSTLHKAGVFETLLTSAHLIRKDILLMILEDERIPSVEKRLCFEQREQKICELLIHDTDSVDVIGLKCLAYEVDLKDICKKKFFPETDCAWILSQTFPVTMNWMQWIGFTSIEESHIKEKLLQHIRQEATDFRGMAKFRKLTFKFIDWCVDDEEECYRIMMEIRQTFPRTRRCVM